MAQSIMMSKLCLCPGQLVSSPLELVYTTIRSAYQDNMLWGHSTLSFRLGDMLAECNGPLGVFLDQFLQAANCFTTCKSKQWNHVTGCKVKEYVTWQGAG